MRTADRETTADKVIARLETGAELVARGTFDLDLVEARKKLAAFALPDPDRFVLLLVEAAHLLAGCSSLVFTITGSATKAHFEGASLDADELRGCFASVLTSARERAATDTRRLLARQRLGLALDAALGIAGGPIEVLSTNADGTLRFVLEPGGGTHLDAKAELSTEATPSLSLTIPAAGLARWTSARARNQRALLREHAWPSTIPIWLDGARIDRGLVLPGLVDGLDVRTDHGESIGRTGWCADRAGGWGSVVFVANGVVVETVFDERLTSGSSALVDASELGRDLSQSKLRRGADYDSLIDQVVAAQSTFDKPAPRRWDTALVATTQQENAAGIMIAFTGVTAIFTGMLALFAGESWLISATFLTVFLVTGLSIAFVQRDLLKRALHQRRILREGRACAGSIQQIRSTKVEDSDLVHHNLTLQVEAEGAPAYEAHALLIGRQRPTPGERVFLRVDPSDPSFVVLDPGGR